MGHLVYPRHFALLVCFGMLVGVGSTLNLSRSFYASFAIYGALHASALVLALRSGVSIWRKCAFIAVAAILSVLALHAGTYAGQLSGVGPGSVNVYWVLALSAAAGAVTYALSIRIIGINALTFLAITATAAVCLLATCIAGFTARYFHFQGAWWLAVVWWHAFSAGLWYFDRRQIPGTAAIVRRLRN